jgi:DNA-binding CsgD family transcriptional regulator
MVPDGVIGRENELARLAAFLECMAHGPAAVVVGGEAGVGKTTLWRAGIEAASDRSFRVLAASPTESETAMSFAALGDLLADSVGEILPELPVPQRDALEVALLLAEKKAPVPDQRVVAVAFLSALRVLSASGPVLVAVDDIQWLDTASASVVGFAGRRLRGERVGLLLAARTAGAASLPLGLEGALAVGSLVSIRVGPLTLGALHRVLNERFALVLPRPVLRKLHETTGGNPFYAIELARALKREGLQGEAGRPLPVPESIGELLRGRIAALSPKTRDALLLVAALSEPRLAVLAAALEGDPRRTLRPAIEAQVISIDGDRIRFAHPLLASATYESAEEVERREAHCRLADLVDGIEERARHLALSVKGPDESVALVLERAAADARARGATAAAADLCEQAVRLTPSDLVDDLQRRTVAAARYSFIAGDTARARVQVEETLRNAREGSVRAEALVVLGLLHRYEGNQPLAAEVLRGALAEPGADERIRADAAQGLASTLFFMREDLEGALTHAALAAEFAARAGSPNLRLEAIAMKGLIEAALGRPGAASTLQAAQQLDDDALVDRVDSSARWAHAYIKLWTDEAPSATRLMRRHRDEAVARGHESSMANILTSLALAEYLAGRWEEATRIAEQAHEAALQAGQRHYEGFSLSVRALVRASLGHEAEARADADRALALAGEHNAAVARIHSVWALGLLELSLDRPAEAVHVLSRERERLLAAGVGEPGAVPFVADEIEALVALARVEDAVALLSWLEQRGRALNRGSALAAAGRCRGLLAAARGEIDVALSAFDGALAAHERVPMQFELARTLLALGTVQRRGKKRSAARETLGRALSTFEQLGAALWAEKAGSELARIAGRAPGGWGLTPTEYRVAELVAAGLTNREAAARLFLTQKTVEFHLRNIYRKLGVRSRTELARSSDLKP